MGLGTLSGCGGPLLENTEIIDSRLAERIEIPSSVSAVNFYQKQGCKFKDGRGAPDDEGLVRMEKWK